MTALFDIVLLLLVLAVAFAVVSVRDAQTAVVGFIAFGLLLALAWVRLSSVDVALTEAAIGGGATGVLLLRGIARLRNGKGQPRGRALHIGAATVSAGFAAAIAGAVLHAPDPAPTLAPAAMEHIAALGLGNPVSAVLFGYRALDTLLEKIVVVLALLGVWSLAPDALASGRPDLRGAALPSDTLAFLARTLTPFGLLFGIYLAWTGADHPGGTFQAGAVLAAMWLLVLMAGLREPPETRNRLLRGALMLGPAAFLAAGFAGIWLAGAFLAFPPGAAKPIIVLLEIPLTLSIALALALLVAGPAQRAPR
ncbi:MAG TPA: MnhB domain-containing protein [Xanthobacteraceae bacterium]|nr:MnhB domain-containing protein [Xanthobacteraceae bacterium]